MDARLDVEDLPGLQTGDAHIIRNAGGVVTEDAIRSLIIAHDLLDTKEIILIQHTRCGMLSFTDDLLTAGLEGDAAAERLAWDVRRGMSAILHHPWIPPTGPDAVSVRGFISDLDTAALEDVSNPGPQGSIG
jgi:carbonic anhydrase